MAQLEFSDDLALQVNRAAQLTGETPDAFLRKAVRSRLEDVEDMAIATERLENPGKRISLGDLSRQQC